jgi:M-phase inducer tyrosine phosphatase
LDGVYNDKIDTFLIVDCRYSYEYIGGHIVGAENISCPTLLEKRFFENPMKNGPRTIVVFHCEYSVQRAPRMYLHFFFWVFTSDSRLDDN